MFLTNKADGFWEKLREILAPVIGDGNLLVLKFPSILEHVGKIRGHVQDVLDAKLLQDIQVRGVLCTAKIQMRQDLHGERGLGVGQRAAVRVGSAAWVSVNVWLDVWGVGADPESSETQDLGGRWTAAGGTVEVRLAHGGKISLKFAEATCKVQKKKKNI